MRLSSKSIITPVLAALLLTGLTAVRSQADDAPAQGFGTVSGQVMNLDGKAAGSLVVNIWTPQLKKPKPGTDIGDRTMGKKGKGTGAGKAAPTPIATATTGADGSFTLSNVAAGTYMIDAGTRKDPSGYDHKTITVKDGQTTTVQLALKAPTAPPAPKN